MATLLEFTTFQTGPAGSVSAGLLKLLRIAAILLVVAAAAGAIMSFRVAVYAARFPMTFTAAEPIERSK